MCFYRNPKGLKEFVNQRTKRKGHNLTEVARPQEVQCLCHPGTALDGWVSLFAGERCLKRRRRRRRRPSASATGQGRRRRCPATSERQQQQHLSPWPVIITQYIGSKMKLGGAFRMLPAPAFSSPLKADSSACCCEEETNGALEGWGEDVSCSGTAAPHSKAKFGLMDWGQMGLQGRRVLLSR